MLEVGLPREKVLTDWHAHQRRSTISIAINAQQPSVLFSFQDELGNLRSRRLDP
jgi:hypothetical protein